MTARLPRRTVRLRLTLWYGCLFLPSGTALLGITYGLVVRATGGIVFAGYDGNYGIVTPGSPHHVNDVGNSTTAGIGPPLSAHQAQLLAQRSQAQALHQHGAELHALLVQSGIALAIMAACSIALGWFLAGRALRPVRTIITSARRISATSLHERLALAGPQEELRELGDIIDALLTRLEASFQAQRQFIANASH